MPGLAQTLSTKPRGRLAAGVNRPRPAPLPLAERLIRFIESELRVPEGKLVGQPVKLLDFQKQFLRDTFAEDADGNRFVRRAILSMGRKNSKSTTIAMLVLAALGGPLTTRNAQVYSGALAREQAALIYSLAKKMALQTPEFAEMLVFRDSAKEIWHPASGSVYRALSAEGSTAYGLSPTIVIADECGQWGPKNALYEALSTAAGAQANPLEIFISTQAADDLSLFSVLIDDALANPDPRTVLHLYTAPAEADPWSPETWKLANPALGHFLQESFLRDWADRAKRIPSEEAAFRNLALNQRVRVDQAFVTQSVWDSNIGHVPELADLEGRECYAALDLSSVKDLSALVLVFPDDDGGAVVVPFVFTPEATLEARARTDRAPYPEWVRSGHMEVTPGSSVDLRWIVARLADVCARFDVKAIAYDRWRIEFLKTLADTEGLSFPLEPFGQGFKDMGPALQELETLLLAGKLSHGGHPVLKYAAASAVAVSDPAGNKKLDKSKSNARIDPLVALAMAVGAWKRGADPESNIYTSRERDGLILL